MINSIGERLDFYKLMFNLGKESNLHEKLYELLTGHLNHVVNDNDKIGDIPFPYFYELCLRRWFIFNTSLG